MNDNGLVREVCNILWTSGWDSTFRLLDVLHSTDLPVQPYYLISLGRKSAQKEIATMEKILNAIHENPRWAGRVRNPIMRIADQYRYADTPYWTALEKIRETWALGTQYLTLAIFRDTEKIQDLELGIQGPSFNTFREFVPDKGMGLPRRLSAQAPAEYQLLFHSFLFPILGTSKLEMAAIAKQKGFMDILNLTWFCHAPIQGVPCGLCNPCLHTIKEGLHERIGPEGMARYSGQKGVVIQINDEEMMADAPAFTHFDYLVKPARTHAEN